LEEPVECGEQGDSNHSQVAIKRKDNIFDCHRLVTATMAECIVRLHCMTGCDSYCSFYGKGKKLVFDQVAKSLVAQWQFLWCGDDLHLKEEVEDELLGFVRNVIYSDSKSNTMAEVRAASGKT